MTRVLVVKRQNINPLVSCAGSIPAARFGRGELAQSDSLWRDRIRIGYSITQTHQPLQGARTPLVTTVLSHGPGASLSFLEDSEEELLPEVAWSYMQADQLTVLGLLALLSFTGIGPEQRKQIHGNHALRVAAGAGVCRQSEDPASSLNACAAGLSTQRGIAWA